MEKKRLSKIMAKADREKIISLAEEVKKNNEVIIVKSPEKVLTMIKMREPVKESLFYIGEVIVTEVSVTVNGVNGMAVLMGDDYEKTLAMAIIDGAVNCRYITDETQFLEWEKQQITREEKENAMFMKTMVNFNSMS